MTVVDEVLVAIDIGTSSARAAAFDLEGERSLEVRRPYATRFPRPGWVEQSAADWRAAGLGALAELVRRLGKRHRVLAVSLTGQCPSVVLVDRRGRPVLPGMTYRDNRATIEARAMRDRFGDEAIHARTGHLPAAFHVGPKLRWVRDHQPDAWAQSALALQPRDWLALVLTGEAVTDGTHAAATLLYNLGARAWDPGLLDALGVPPGMVPRLAGSRDVVGTLRPAIAARVGLPAATPVILGGADSQACALGAGVLGAGPVSEMAGSSTCLNAVVSTPLKALEVTHYPHVVGRGLTTETGINTTGSAIAWIADLLYGGRAARATADDYRRLDAEAGAVPAGADGVAFLPVLADGERTDPDLRGAVAGLSLRHGRAVVARAVLEAVAYAIRAQLDLLTAVGTPVKELRVSGGDARLATWNQVKANVLGIPVRTVPGDAAVTGVAMLAGLGAGVYRDEAEAVARCVRPSAAVLPDPATSDVHALGFARHLELAESAAVRR